MTFRTEDLGASDTDTFGLEILPDAIAAWLDAHAPGWRLLERKSIPSPNEAVYETVLCFPRGDQATAFRTVWAGFLHARVLAYHRHDVEVLREEARLALNTLHAAPSRHRRRRAKTHAQAERALERAVGTLRRLERTHTDASDHGA